MTCAPLLLTGVYNLVQVCKACICASGCASGASVHLPTTAQPAPRACELGPRMRAAAERAQASTAARRALYGSSAARRRPRGGCYPRSRRPGSPGRPCERRLRGTVGPAGGLRGGQVTDESACDRAMESLGWAVQAQRRCGVPARCSGRAHLQTNVLASRSRSAG